MKQEWVDRYKTAGSYSARTRILREALAEANESEQVLAATYQGALSNAIGQSDDKRYKMGSLGKNWLNAFSRVDQERMAGNITTSVGE